jgi:putative aldouronate transport system substrate-binding protein
MFVLALFAGCGGNPEDSDKNSGTAAGAEGDNAEEESPYNYAVGKYKVYDDGLPHEQYEYELPLSTTDEEFSWWTTCYTPQYIPDEGFGAMEYRTKMAEMTGVHINYVLVNANSMAENFSVLMASDALCDINCNAYSFYTGTVNDALEDGWFVDLYDYKDYFPNYLYWIYFHDDIDVTSKIFYDKETILAFYCVLADPLQTTGYFVRQDWLDDLGMQASDIVTYEDLYGTLSAIKASGSCEYPLLLNTTIEPLPGTLFPGYNTTCYVYEGLPYARVVDGNVQFTLTQQDDYDLLLMLRKWMEDGLVYPNLHNPADTEELATVITTGEVGYVHMNPGEVADYKARSVDPDMNYVATARTRLTDDQILKYYQKPSYFSYGSSVISAKCENIPLACTWCDWWYSESGSFYVNYGIEGQTWEYDDNGNIMLTEFVTNNPDGMGPAWCLLLYAQNGLCDHGVQYHQRKYKYPGGEKIVEFHSTWIVEGYKGEYDWPSGIKFSDEQNERLKELSADIGTYVNETYLGFVDGSRALSGWEDYLNSVYNMGLNECLEIYQTAYDDFMAEYGK